MPATDSDAAPATFPEGAEIEEFTVYGFSISYPQVCRIEFNPKARREKGDIVFHFPDRERIFLSWGKLQDVQKRFQTLEAQVEQTMKIVQKSSNIVKLERTKQLSLTVNSHRAEYNHIKIDEKVPGLFSRRSIARTAHSLHLRCDQSGRYFAIYAMLSPSAPEDFGDLFLSMSNSFKCH